MASDQAAQIGARLRERREEMGLTRRQLAAAMEGVVTDNDLYRWEKGRHRPQDDTLAAIARALGRDYAWAMGTAPNGPAPSMDDIVGDDVAQPDLTESLRQINAALAVLFSERVLVVATEQDIAQLRRQLGGGSP